MQLFKIQLCEAILKFLSDQLQVKSIICKFSEPGQSQIQETDYVHIALDKYLKRLEINYLKNFKTDFKNFARYLTNYIFRFFHLLK